MPGCPGVLHVIISNSKVILSVLAQGRTGWSRSSYVTLVSFSDAREVVEVGEQGFTQPLHISILFRLCSDESGAN